jgi:nicotinamide-nucleotide amidase
MQAVILSIGDELTLGQTIDTNSAWISRELAAVGCVVAAHVTVADDQPQIERTIAQSAARCDWLIVTGGLGPTEDDLTRGALANVLGEPLELNAAWLERMTEFFAVRNVPMPSSNRVQAMIPRGATALQNDAGTALGIAAWIGDCRVFVLPGVPKEMRLMFQQAVLPPITAAASGAVILSRTLHTLGLGESAVAQKLGSLMQRDRNPSVGTTVANGIVSLRINARFPSRQQAAEKLEETDRACRQKLGELIFGQDEQTIQQVVGQLLRGKAIVATAESCTGGLLAKMITDVPGSSDYFSQGWVTYSNQAKRDLLGVPEELIQQHGAVSEEVVRAMSAEARRRAAATYALAISGIAGPDGGSESKPVGTTWIALASPESVSARRFVFGGDREMVRDRAAKMALTILRFAFLRLPLPF